MESLEAFSWQRIAFGSGALVGSGALCGGFWAALKGYHIGAHAFSMGSNWLLVGLPFMTLREGIRVSLVQYYRQTPIDAAQSDVLKEQSDWIYTGQRDKIEIVASAMAGGGIGAGLGYIWRGPFAILPGMLAYGLIATSGQFVYSMARWYRMRESWKILNSIETEKIPSIWDKPAFKQHAHTEPSKMSDPFKDAFKSLFIYLDRMGEGVPDWASPFANALDLDYRKKLNIRIVILEEQIKELKEKLDNNMK